MISVKIKTTIEMHFCDIKLILKFYSRTLSLFRQSIISYLSNVLMELKEIPSNYYL